MEAKEFEYVFVLSRLVMHNCFRKELEARGLLRAAKKFASEKHVDTSTEIYFDSWAIKYIEKESHENIY